MNINNKNVLRCAVRSRCKVMPFVLYLCSLLLFLTELIFAQGDARVLREYWTNVLGLSVKDIPKESKPTGIDFLPNLRATNWNKSSQSENWADDYGQILTTYLIAPETGDYNFWITSNNASELYLSTDSTVSNKQLIASAPNWTGGASDWYKYASQKSEVIHLIEGELYFLQVLQKEWKGNDYLSVAWNKPGESNMAPSEQVPSEVLALRPEFPLHTAIRPSADAYVRGGRFRDSNFGNDTALVVKVDNKDEVYTRYSFLRFDLSDLLKSDIDQATLRLKLKADNGNKGDFHELHFVDSDTWDENRINFTNRPSLTSFVDRAKHPSLDSWLEFDVTELVAQEAMGDGKLSLSVSSDGDRHVTYYSSEYEDEKYQPQLVIRALTNSGVFREYYTDITGVLLDDIPIGQAPSGVDHIAELSATDWSNPALAQNWGDDYGQILTGYIVAPETGDYRFWVSSDESSEFYLSSSELSTESKLVASVPGKTNVFEWDKFEEQKSELIPLVEGKSYFFQAYHKEGVEEDHLTIGWSRPGESSSRPSQIIPQSVLHPYQPLSSKFSFQAERAVLEGAPIANQYSGAENGLYVSLSEPSSNSISWRLKAEGLTSAIFGIRYAIAGPLDGEVLVKLNGVTVIESLVLESTSSWKEKGFNLRLQSGENVISLHSISGVTLNIDTLFVEAAGFGTETLGGGALNSGVNLQAEASTLLGASIKEGVIGSEGERIVAFDQDKDQSVTWNVTAARDGHTILSFRYALEGAKSRHMALEVNNVEITDTFPFEPTGSWNSWADQVALNVSLKKGVNKVTLRSNGEGGPYLDSLTLFGNTNKILELNNPHFVSVTDGKNEITEGIENILLDSSFAISIAVYEIGDGIDGDTVNKSTIRLINVKTSEQVNGEVNTTGGGDAVSFTPSSNLGVNTTYKIVAEGVKSDDGESYPVFTRTFTTGTEIGTASLENLVFEKTRQNNGDLTASLLFTEDFSQLYATSLIGEIIRWDVDELGVLSNKQILMVEENRAFIGLAFDPVVANRLWFTNNDDLFAPGVNFTSKLSYIDIDPGNNFSGVAKDFAFHFPRSSKDHLTNSLAFGPDGFLYLMQGSNSAMGSPDQAWGNVPESLLNANVLRIDTSIVPPVGGFDLHPAAPNNYNPFVAGAPVKIYASGVRNGYDLLWHSNGSLYVANNGSAPGGNSPDDPNTLADESIRKGSVQNDLLYEIVEGGYYGHPNPSLGKYIRDGGNPTAKEDLAETTDYPVGTLPDPDYKGFVYDFGQNRSANGMDEYDSSAFRGLLDGVILVTEYSGGDRIVGLKLDRSGNVISDFVVAGGLRNPLDVAVHKPSGSILVTNTSIGTTFPDAQGLRRNEIMKFSPKEEDAPLVGPHFNVINPKAVAGADHFIFHEIEGPLLNYARDRETLNVTLRNFTDEDVIVSNLEINEPFYLVDASLSGGFTIKGKEVFDIRIRMDASGPSSTNTGIYHSDLVVTSNATDGPTHKIPLSGVWMPGPFGGREPSIDTIIDLFRWSNTADGKIVTRRDVDNRGVPNLIVGQAFIEIDEKLESAYYFEAADSSKPVVVTQIAAFHSPKEVHKIEAFSYDFDPSLGDLNDMSAFLNQKREMIFKHHIQYPNTILPPIEEDRSRLAAGSFRTGSPFTLSLQNSKRSTDPARYGGRQGVRVLRLFDQATGNLIDHTYLVVMDFATGPSSNYDYQDNVYVVSNMKPYAGLD